MDFARINFGDEKFPRLLKEIQNPPRQIFVRGNFDADADAIAIVGTRKATDAGKALAYKTAKILAGRGFAVISGLAMGIDTSVHEGAIAGGGKTVAVLGNGIDKIYPAQNQNLAEKITRNGAVISEYEPGIPALQYRFLERNRIVSGLSRAVVVIEAPDRSGSLATARLAAESGREVFVFPGPAGHPNWLGSHKLIRDGARLVNSADDVFEDLGVETEPVFKQPEKVLNAALAEKFFGSILDAIKSASSGLSVDKIAELTKLEPQAVNRELTELLLSGIIYEKGFLYFPKGR